MDNPRQNDMAFFLFDSSGTRNIVGRPAWRFNACSVSYSYNTTVFLHCKQKNKKFILHWLSVVLAPAQDGSHEHYRPEDGYRRINLGLRPMAASNPVEYRPDSSRQDKPRACPPHDARKRGHWQYQARKDVSEYPEPF
jgi:hypothetical protein